MQCLKYMVLANMLMESKVDPFDAQEAKPYKQDPEVRLPSMSGEGEGNYIAACLQVHVASTASRSTCCMSCTVQQVLQAWS